MNETGNGNGNGNKLYRTNGGGFDIKKLVEQSLPVLITGLLVFYGNSLVTNSKVDGLAEQIKRLEIERLQMQVQMQTSSERLIALSAQVTAYLGQQTQLNAAMDARLTYIERGMRMNERNPR